EGTRMLRHGFGEGGTAFDGGSHVFKGMFKRAGLLLLGKHAQGSKQREPGILENGELLSELGDLRRGDGAEGEGTCLRRTAGRGFGFYVCLWGCEIPQRKRTL